MTLNSVPIRHLNQFSKQTVELQAKIQIDLRHKSDLDDIGVWLFLNQDSFLNVEEKKSHIPIFVIIKILQADLRYQSWCLLVFKKQL